MVEIDSPSVDDVSQKLIVRKDVTQCPLKKRHQYTQKSDHNTCFSRAFPSYVFCERFQRYVGLGDHRNGLTVKVSLAAVTNFRSFAEFFF